MDKIEKGPKEIFSPDIQKDLLLLEEQEGSVNFKFGVIYMKQGQITDDEILSNGKIFHDCQSKNSFILCNLRTALKKMERILNIKGNLIVAYSYLKLFFWNKNHY